MIVCFIEYTWNKRRCTNTILYL